MRKLLSLFAFFTCFSAIAQKAEVYAFHTLDKTISAGINDKYDIEIFLKVHKFSDVHAGIYSVKGWYWYLDKRIKIPLVGIFDGDLTLFHFKDEKSRKRVLELDPEAGEDFFTGIEILKNTAGFDEKLSFAWNDLKVSGEWQKGDKKLPVKTLENTGFEDVEIAETHEFLRITPSKDKTYDIDLYSLNLFRTDFSLVGFHSSKTENRVLLRYDYASKPYSQDMCGAGMEQGYVTLRFDGDYNLVSFDDVQTESCLVGIFSEPDEKNRHLILTNKDGKNQKWLVDAENAQITKVR